MEQSILILSSSAHAPTRARMDCSLDPHPLGGRPGNSYYDERCDQARLVSAVANQPANSMSLKFYKESR